MRQIVLLKVIPDLTEIKIDRETRKPSIEGVKRKISEVDKRALEAAIRLKEKAGGEVIALSQGGEKTQTALLEALAMGADKSYVIYDPELSDIDPNATSLILKAAVELIGGFDLILAGEMSLDGMNSQVGPRIAELLDLPQVTYIKELIFYDGVLKAVRDLDTFDEVVEVPFPAVLSVIREINEPRIPGLMQIMKAKKKPQTTWKTEDLNLDPAQIIEKSYVKVLNVVAPEVDRKQITIKAETVEEVAEKLADALMEEGVI
jgi:electron transfer flavoprotein beta subunit